MTRMWTSNRALTRLGAVGLLAAMASLSCSQGEVAKEETAASASAACVLGQECCPTGYTQVTLTPNSDSFSTTAARQCIVALGGSDIMSINGANDIVLAGDGDDNVFAGPTSLVRGGNGNDTINIYGGPGTVYGGAGDDTINAANGDMFVVPGPGRDTVAMGAGNDTLALYDMCEITGGGKTLDGGTGFNTLITPIPLDQLIALGNSVSNFQNIVVQSNSCKSECVTQPDCHGHGTCVEGAGPGQPRCLCEPPFAGPFCSGICSSTVDTDGDGVLDCVDECPYDRLKTKRGVCDCGTRDTDSDGDGFPDCMDRCNLDGDNVTPGSCGCKGQAGLKPAGTPCTDTACPQSGAVCDGAGVCGNRSACQPNPVCRYILWQGTSYWICPPPPTTGVPPDAGPGPTSDGGPKPEKLPPDLDASLAPDVVDAGPPTGALSRNNAQLACRAKGLFLLRIDSWPLNEVFRRLSAGTAMWLGANDISAVNVWRWATVTSNNGDQFWSGGPTGSRVNNRFANWAAGAPGPQRCAALRASDGLWIDADCSQPLAYACQFPTPRRDGGIDPPPGNNDQPAPRQSPCIPEPEAGLPATYEELKQQIEKAEAGIFEGAAANPPAPDATCIDNPGANAIGLDPVAHPGEGCQFTEVQSGTCITSAECAPGFTCRQVKDDRACSPPDGGFPGAIDHVVDGSTCPGRARCGRLICPPIDPVRCGQVELCTTNTDFDAGLDPGSNLDAEPFNTSKLFDAGVPEANPTAQYVDDFGPGTGKNHPWCKLNPQDPNSVKPAQQPKDTKAGSSGGGTKISFTFDPDLIFDVDPHVLPLGEADMHLHAQAKFLAAVSLNDFLGQNYTAPIIDVVAGITVDRCSISSDETHFQVLGLDFIDPDELPHINTADPMLSPEAFAASRRCRDALDNFKLLGDRAKKAFRDAQQVLAQYYAIRDAGFRFDNDLCTQLGIAAVSVPFFPGGNACAPHEPPEITIDRMIQFYQDPGFGEIDKLRRGAGELFNATGALNSLIGGPSIKVDFGDKPKQESQTIINLPFAIGPIPMVLQVDVFAQYGIGGRFELEFKFPTNLDVPLQERRRLAHAKVGVVPRASAGLSAFVGAGVDLGPIRATVGIEGAVNLATLEAPIAAGVGLDVAVEDDARLIPDDIKPPVAAGLKAFQFQVPKSFKFFVSYDYGAALHIRHILAGEINGRLRIKFFFFSRTWRKRVVQFNGFDLDVNILGDGNNPDVNARDIPMDNAPNASNPTAHVAEGQTQMGRSEAQLPLMQLAFLPPGPNDDTQPFALALLDPDAGPLPTTPVSKAKVEKFFYDDLCCQKLGEECAAAGAPACCGPLVCTNADAGAGIRGTCQGPPCRTVFQSCTTTADCCVTDETTCVDGQCVPPS